VNYKRTSNSFIQIWETFKIDFKFGKLSKLDFNLGNTVIRKRFI